MEEIERKAEGGFLGIGACRERTAATVKLPRKRINNESRARAPGLGRKEKKRPIAARKKTFYFC